MVTRRVAITHSQNRLLFLTLCILLQAMEYSKLALFKRLNLSTYLLILSTKMFLMIEVELLFCQYFLKI